MEAEAGLDYMIFMAGTQFTPKHASLRQTFLLWGWNRMALRPPTCSPLSREQNTFCRRFKAPSWKYATL